MLKNINEKKFYIWFLAITCFLIGFLVGYGVAFNNYGSGYFDQFSGVGQTKDELKNKLPDNQFIIPLKPMEPLSESEKKLIEQWLKENDLNEFGDPKDTIYTGGTPLFDERTGRTIDKFEYIIGNHKDKPWLR